MSYFLSRHATASVASILLVCDNSSGERRSSFPHCLRRCIGQRPLDGVANKVISSDQAGYSASSKFAARLLGFLHDEHYVPESEHLKQAGVRKNVNN